MDDERWKKIDNLVDAAMEMAEGDRENFVREHSEGDESLAGAVLDLLKAQEDSAEFLDRSAIGMAAEAAVSESFEAAFSLTGQTVGPYEVGELIGSGGMGDVYEAFDRKLKRKVALKILSTSLGRDSEPVKRFEIEARAISKLNHPVIVTIHDVGRKEKTSFIATELVEGRTLRELIKSPIKVRDAVAIFVQVCGALAAAHRAGIIHRDIKPENIMLREDGYVKVLDFGLAKLTQIEPSIDNDFASTRRGAIIGTPAYMSPSQITGEKADSRTDLWSCGVVLYELLTGVNPFKGANRREAFEKILSDSPKPPSEFNPDCPAALDSIVLKLLEKNPSLGYQTANDVKADLKRVRRDIDSSPFVSGSSGSLTYESGRARTFLWASIPVTVLLGAAAVVLFYFQPWNKTRGVDWSRARSIQLTFESGAEVYPSISPDGHSFVYASGRDGDFDIYLLRIGGSKEINLTADSEADDTMPAFSPDGSTIAFRSERSPAGIYTMGATGENPKLVSDVGFNPAWSPDGQKIAVASRFEELPSVRTPSAIITIDLRSGEKKTIIDNYALQPDWSPDGSRIAFWYTENRGKRIVATLPATGGQAVDLAFDSNTNWNPKWAPDGRYLYYASDRGGSTGFWRVPVDTSTGKALGEHESVPTPAKFNRHLSFSSDGKRMVYVQTSVSSNLLEAEIRPDGKLMDEPKWLTRGDFEISSPQLLPDGSGYIARLIRETRDDLVFIDRTTGALRDLTNDEPFDRYGRVSPDGTKIAFASDRSGTYQIWLMNLDGSGLVRLTDARTIASIPAWSPDGKFLSYDSSEKVYVLDMERFAATGKAEVTTTFPRTERGGFFRVWEWSPDGKMLAGSFDQKEGPGVGVYDLSTGKYERLTNYTAIPRWMPDSRNVIFVNDGRPMLSSLDTGETRTAFPEIKGHVRNIAVSDDGKTVYFTLRESESNIWLLDASRQ